MFLGRKVVRRVLATDIGAELGLITCVWSRIGQMARPSTPEWTRTLVLSDCSQVTSVWQFTVRRQEETGSKEQSTET